MKTTIDIPDQELKDAMRFAGTETKRVAVVAAIVEYNRRHRMAALTRYLGTCKALMTEQELAALRSQE